MNVIYNKNTGHIDRAISEGIDFRIYLENYPKDILNQLESVNIEVLPKNLSDYYIDIKTKRLTKYPQEILEEKRKYGRILTEEERVYLLLKPSPQEIQKAENTIEILTLIQEVI